MTLLRRIHFDLIGLPPAPNHVAAFLEAINKHGLDKALEDQVDALLQSSRYGERWGRHWLDVARFAESSGKETNVTFPHAWRYRDYVIDAFNADMPYSRFITEQIAGDLLTADSDAERARLLIGTGFLAVGPKSLNETNVFQSLADIADEQIDTVARAFMASSVACARCHDHKFDPFSMEDYYALAGVFISTETYYGTSVAPGNQRGGDLIVLPEVEGQLVPNPSIPAKQFAKMKADLAALKKRGEELKAASMQAFKEKKDATEVVSLAEVLGILWRTGGLEGKLETVDEQGRALPLCMGVKDRGSIYDAPLLERGEIAKAGAKIPRGFPKVVLLENAPVPSADRSGRLELAQWLTHPDHPLTARVLVNRVWHHLMGAGIVRTVDHFGFKGERPSHPELLDHLAIRFAEEGGSIKKLIRHIVLSRTYRQASTYDQASFVRDPDNRLLWRANKRRMDAELIRDSMLFVSGHLDASRRPSSLIAEIGDREVGVFSFIKQAPADLDGSDRRSVYLPILRDRLPDVLDLFDFADPSMVSGARENTNVPVQALYFMNSTAVRRMAEGLADRVLTESSKHAQRVERAFMHCFNRKPDPREVEFAETFFGRFHGASASDDPALQRAAYVGFCQTLLAAAEFRYID